MMVNYLLAACVMLAAVDAHAQCAFNSSSARSFKAQLVRPFAKCDYGSATVEAFGSFGGIDGCQPVAGASGHCLYSLDACSSDLDCSVTPMDSCVQSGESLFRYADTGSCSFSIKTKVFPDCSVVEDSFGTPVGLLAVPCQVHSLKGKCKGVLTSSGDPVGDLESGFSLSLVLRFTMDDGTSNDVTSVDVPFVFGWGTPNSGKMALSTSINEAIAVSIGPAQATIDPCASMEIVSLMMLDPSGGQFGRIGLSTR